MVLNGFAWRSSENTVLRSENLKLEPKKSKIHKKNFPLGFPPLLTRVDGSGREGNPSLLNTAADAVWPSVVPP